MSNKTLSNQIFSILHNAELNETQKERIESLRPLLEEESIPSFNQATEKLAQLFDEIPDKNIAAALGSLYDVLNNQEQAEYWMKQFFDIHQKEIDELNAKLATLGIENAIKLEVSKIEE